MVKSFQLDPQKLSSLSFADEANQITEYADETDLWGSDQETERINDYWLD